MENENNLNMNMPSENTSEVVCSDCGKVVAINFDLPDKFVCQKCRLEEKDPNIFKKIAEQLKNGRENAKVKQEEREQTDSNFDNKKE